MLVSFSGAPNGSLWNTTAITLLDSSQITSVASLSFDQNGTLYIADEYQSMVVRKLLKNSTISTVVAGTLNVSGSSNIQLNFPQAAHVDGNGNLYVSDCDNQRIQKYINGSTNGITIAGITGSSGNALSQLNAPRYFAFDETDTYMYISDQNNHRVIRFSTNSTSGQDGIIVAGNGTSGNTSTTLNIPWGVEYQPALSTDLFIGNWGGHTIMRWTPGAPSGAFIAGVPGNCGSDSLNLCHPYGVRVDNYLNVYVADAYNNRIQMFCANNKTGITIAGTGVAGNTATQLNDPHGIAFDDQMNLYVADPGNSRIQKFMKL